ncbi:SDR family oxidoreductase [Arenibaculum pallidiluteum]|uniref:SDR family oxidoreductase n=1 Tax=Arenibaculum pallidiluteum TaxID=2812559 RepID=UPI001A97061A|nr:SDR family oxidoreductase [Arenibaculum pallidiluteum]
MTSERGGDPKEGGAKPPFPEQRQDLPGSEAAMDPRPDYGETSYQGSGKLEGKAALITGGDSGIGRAVALAYAREGADVAISYLSEEEDAAETARVVEAAGRRCLRLPGDIQDERHCRSLVERTMGEFGRLDVLVNNAAYQTTHENVDDLPTEEIERAFRTNIIAMFHLSKAAMAVMKPGSAIINTASIQAYHPSPMLLHYASTKGAIVAFTKALGQQAPERGIRVNAVAPGPVWTPLIPATMPPDNVKTFGQQTPMKRPAQPAELAPVYVFLASPDSSYVTAMVYGVTGGMVME